VQPHLRHRLSQSAERVEVFIAKLHRRRPQQETQPWEPFWPGQLRTLQAAESGSLRQVEPTPEPLGLQDVAGQAGNRSSPSSGPSTVSNSLAGGSPPSSVWHLSRTIFCFRSIRRWLETSTHGCPSQVQISHAFNPALLTPGRPPSGPGPEHRARGGNKFSPAHPPATGQHW